MLAAEKSQTRSSLHFIQGVVNLPPHSLTIVKVPLK
jgi:hypothetical protein